MSEETPAEEPKITAYDLFCMKHFGRIQQWMSDHPEPKKFKPLPITVDAFGNFIWMNREQRRKK
jgi:hypothetical protein